MPSPLPVMTSETAPLSVGSKVTIVVLSIVFRLPYASRISTVSVVVLPARKEPPGTERKTSAAAPATTVMVSVRPARVWTSDWLSGRS